MSPFSRKRTSVRVRWGQQEVAPATRKRPGAVAAPSYEGLDMKHDTASLPGPVARALDELAGNPNRLGLLTHEARVRTSSALHLLDEGMTAEAAYMLDLAAGYCRAVLAR